MKDNILSTSLYEDDVYLAEEIYNPFFSPNKQFILYNKQQDGIDIIPEFEAEKDGKTITVKPLDFNLIENRIVLLPSAIDTKTTDEELDKKIISFLHKWVDIEPFAEQLSLYYIKMTWIYDRLTVVPYLRALGTFGAGKTRTVQTIGSLCYKPLFLSGASSDAYLFRIIELFKGTLIVNELERLNTDMSGQIVIILNNGFEKGLGVGRIEGDKTKTPVIYDVFSPKIISAREPFKDLALESRIITHRLFPTTRKDIPFAIDDSFWKEAEEIRNSLLYYRVQWVAKLCGTAGVAGLSLDDGKKKALYELEPRLRQTFSPLFYVIPTDKADLFISFAKQYQQEIIEDRGLELEGIVAKTLLTLHASQAQIAVKGLREAVNVTIDDDRFKITPQKLGKILKGLGIKTQVQGHDKMPYIIPNDFIFESLRLRYDAGIPFQENSADPQDPPLLEDKEELADEQLIIKEQTLRESLHTYDKNSPEYADVYHEWFALRNEGITRKLFAGIVPQKTEPYMTPPPTSSLPMEELYG